MLWALLAAAVAFLVSLLLIPVHLSVHLGPWPGRGLRLRVRWLLARGGTDFGRVPKASTPESSRDEHAARPVAQTSRRVHPVAMLRSRGFLAALLRLGRRLLDAVRVQELAVHLRAGFEDPADTGLLCAWILPVSSYAAARYPDSIDVGPDFSGEALELAVACELDLTPARILWPLLAFGLSPGTLRGLAALRSGRVG